MNTKTKTYDPACLLQTDVQLAMYLQDAWEDGEDAVFLAALNCC